jgi:TolB-like protein/Flp pilus assembly protein TadD/predicted Ser/Thr protein kinase
MHDPLPDTEATRDPDAADSRPGDATTLPPLPPPAALAPPALAPPARIGRYELRRRLGQGGMGTVFLAHDTLLDRAVALKVPRLDVADRPELRERFLREARAAATLSHPALCPIYDAGEADGVLFLAMAYLEGEPLSAVLRRQGALPLATAIELVHTLALAMHEAHAKGVVHRDLKPGNVMIDAAGRPVILDFGLALRDCGGDVRLTHSGAALGTPAYMPPEQLDGDLDAMGPRSDVYSLGVILFELLTGRLPFAGTFTELVAQVAKEPPPSVDLLRPEAGAALDAVCRRALAKRPADRYGSMQAFAAALAAKPVAKPAAAPAPRKAPRQRAKARSGFDSLAVLPLEFDGPAESEYLGDCLTENLIACLARLPGLRVMARTTVFRYKGQAADPREVGKALKVRAVLTGRLRLRGDRLDLTAELIETRTGALAWTGKLERDLAAIEVLEDTLAKQVAERLRPAEAASLAPRPVAAGEAYQLVLKGRHLCNKRTGAALHAAVELFRQAVDQDPAFGLGWSGLADAYHLLGVWGHARPLDYCPRARQAAVRALELQPDLAEAHTALAVIDKDFTWDFAAAERGFRRALVLNPNHAGARMGLGECLGCQCRADEAITELRRALELDPLSQSIAAALGRHGYFYARRYDLAAAELHKAIAFEPHYWMTHNFLGWIELFRGRRAEALKAFETAAALEDNPEMQAGLGYALGTLGRTDEAQAVRYRLEELGQNRYVTPVNVAVVLVGMGQTDEALKWLQQARADRNQWISEMRADPAFDPLRGDARFVALLQGVGEAPSELQT